jgi:phenylacetate-CoA ligase
VLEDDAGVFDFQLLQRDDHTVTLRLGADVAAGRGGPVQRCRNVLRAFAQAQGTVPLTVLHEAGVPPARGRSGKVQRVLGLPVREPRAHARPAGRRRSAAGAPSLNS